MALQISDTEPRIQYTATSGQTAFAVPFEFFDVADLKVYNGTTLLTYNNSPSSASQYSVTGAGVTGGGSITLGGSGATLNDVITISRDVTIERTSDFPVSGNFPIQTLNTELDKIIAMCQQLNRDLKFSPRAADTTANTFDITFPNLAANKVLSVNSAGTGLEFAQDITDITTIAGIASDVTTVSGIASDVTSVANNNANVTTVASNISNVNTVALNISDIVTVANDLNEAISEIETVASDLQEASPEIDTVAGSISNVDSVGANIASVTTVAGSISNVNTVAGNNTNISTVAGISGNVTTVAGISANVSTVAGISSDVSTVAGDTSYIQSVAGISSDVAVVAGDTLDIQALADIQDGTTATNAITTVAGIASNVTTVATDSANITTVAGISSEIGTVAGISNNVQTVAGISANVTTVANDTTDIGTVASNISNVNSVAGSITNVNTVATNISGINDFADRYRVSATAPTTSLDAGDLYFDTATDTMKVYGSSGWQNAGSSVNGTSQRYNYTATSGQTTFTGSDNNGNTLTYDAGYIDVYLNGVKLLNGTDVTVTSGSSVVLASGASTGDIIDIVAYGTFSVASLNADNLDSGTVPSARISGAYTGITEVGTLTGLTVNGTGTLSTIGNGTQQIRTYVDGDEVSLLTEGSARLDLWTGGNRTIRLDANGDISFYEDTGTTAKFFWDASTERLGIGTSSPSNLLHVKSAGSGTVALFGDSLGNNTVAVTRTTTNPAYISLGALTNLGILTGGPGLTFNTSAADGSSSTERMRIDSDGRVGIGTSAPDAILEVNSGTGDTNSIFKSTDNNCLIIISDNDSSSTIAVESDGSGGALKFNTGGNGSYSGNSEAMRIDSSGNVGIGTSSPSAELHLSATAPVIKTTATNTTSGLRLNIVGGGNELLRIQDDGSEVMRIDSSGNVGIGTSSPAIPLHVYNTAGEIARLEGNDEFAYLGLRGTVSGSAINLGYLGFGNDTGTAADLNITNLQNGAISFTANSSERMRIKSDRVLVGSTVDLSTTTTGCQMETSGTAKFARSGFFSLVLNRTSNDGEVAIFEQDGTQEGGISISGATTSYNGFTGTHWSRLSDNSKPTILKGTILESLDEMMDWYQVQFDITDDEGNTRTEKQSYTLCDGESVGDVITYNHEGTDYQATIIQEDDVKHTKSKISDTVDAKNVYGVFMAWDNDDDTVNDMYVAQTGTFVVRINGSETVSKGDLIQSNGDGTGKVQADDIIRSSTVAKVLSTTKIETYDDGSYIVPCSLHC